MMHFVFSYCYSLKVKLTITRYVCVSKHYFTIIVICIKVQLCCALLWFEWLTWVFRLMTVNISKVNFQMFVILKVTKKRVNKRPVRNKSLTTCCSTCKWRHFGELLAWNFLFKFLRGGIVDIALEPFCKLYEVQ